MLELRGLVGTLRGTACVRALRAGLLAVALAAGPPHGRAAANTTAPEVVAAYPDSAAKRALIDRAYGLLRTALPESACAVLGPWLEPARARGDSLFLLELLLYRASGRAAFGVGAAAEAELREAADLAVALADTTRLCKALRWLSVATSLQGKVDEAGVHARRLLDLARASGDRVHEGWALVGIGYHHLNRERAERSLSAYRRAADIFHTERLAEGETWAQNGLGLALRKLGRYADAANSFRRSLALALTLDNPMSEAMARTFIGEIELAYGDPSRAEDHFRRAREIHLSRGHLREAIPPALDIARCQSELGRYRDAVAALDDALHLSEEQGYRDLAGIVLNRLAGIRRLNGRPRDAAQLARRALAIGPDLPVSTRVASWLELARALADQDSNRAALATLAAGDKLLGDDRGSPLGIEIDLARGALLVAVQRPAAALGFLRAAERRAADLGLTGYQLHALVTQARAWRALARTDSALACLQSGVEIWERDREVPLDMEWRERRSAAGRELFHELGPLLLAYPESRAVPQRVAAAFDLMQRYKARTLRERMMGPGVRDVQSGRPIGVRQLQQQILQPGELLIDGYLGRDALLVFAVTRDSLRAAQIPAAEDIAARCDLYRKLLSGPPRDWGRAADLGPAADLVAASEGIGARLWNRFDDLIAASETFIWSPDDVLNLIPFGELLAGTKTTAPRLGDRPRMRVPSASVLAHLRSGIAEQVAPARRPARLLAIAGGDAPSGRAMPGAEAEVRWLARRFADVEVASNSVAAAGLAAGTFALADYDALHLAAHAVVDDQRPWNSSLSFGTPAVPVALTAGAVADLELSARLVVLASCESGGGGILNGEGVLGLTSGFLSAGVPAVLATLWPVDDRATALLIRRFYEGLAAGYDAAGALREAQIALRADPATAHPFYWAGFVVVGDGTTKLPLAIDRRVVWPWFVAPVLLVAALWPNRRRR